jgi:hypothetical protein
VNHVPKGMQLYILFIPINRYKHFLAHLTTMGYLGSKTRSQELKIEKACEHSNGCSFHPNILEICQEGCFDDI